MGYLGLYAGDYFGYYEGNVVPVSAPVPAGAVLIAAPIEIDHVADAISRLCEYAKSAATDANGIAIGASGFGFGNGFAVLLGGPASVPPSTIVAGPSFVITPYAATVDHVTDAINRLCEQFKSAVPIALEGEIDVVETALGFDSAFDFAMG